MARCGGGLCGGRPPPRDEAAPGTPRQELSLQEYSDSLAASSVRARLPMLFPMYMVRVPDLLRMTELAPHHVLKASGILRKYHNGMGVAVFVSHQWCSRSHPDPKFEQFPALQAVLRRLAHGDLQVQVSLCSLMVFNAKPALTATDLLPLTSGCVWYDYFSVPQQSAPATQLSQHVGMGDEKAVFSIPAYIEACHFFFVLAPPVAHVDFPDSMVDHHSWRQRGWCRLERIARVLSQKQTHVLLAWKEDTLFQVGAEDYMVDPVGEGTFSVEADRARLAPVVVALMESKMQALLQQRDLHRYRRVLSARATLLRGLPGVSPHAVCAPGFRVVPPERPASAQEALDAFLRLYGLRSAKDRAGGSTEPILLAARGGSLATLEALLQSRADVNACERACEPEHGVMRGNTPLLVACIYNADTAIVELLLRYRARVEAKDSRGRVPLMMAAYGGHEDIVKTLLAHAASVSTKELFGSTALHAAAMLGRARVCKQLIAAGARAAPSKDGTSPLIAAVLFGGGRATVEALLEAPDACLDVRWRPQRFSPLGRYFTALSAPHRLWGSTDAFSVLASEMQGVTPLMLAALTGSVGEARALIAAGASTDARSARGRTAAELAAQAGLRPVAVAYFRGHPGNEAAPGDGNLPLADRSVEANAKVIESNSQPSELPGQWLEAAAYGLESRRPSLAPFKAAATGAVVELTH